ncbi:MAG: hypothetical protein ACI8Z7_000149 [Candidatus Nanohaloarchaea archaeon]|jgi:hypothetical protein
MMGTASAQVTSEDSDNSTVTVDVASKVAVDISPSDISYGAIDPGSAVLESNSSSVGGPVGAVEIENIGSENITQVWLNTSVPNDNPFGTGLAQEYDAGNFIEVKPTGEANTVSGVSKFKYINRKEFNETGDLSYVFTPEDGGEWKYGRFRVGSQEYFWAVNTTGTPGTCQTDGSDDFLVGQNAHNKTNTGSTDFTDLADISEYGLTNAGSGDAEALATGVTVGDRNYDVLVECGDPTYTVRSSYNVNALGAPDLVNDGSAVSHILNATEATDASQELQPGEYFGINTSIRVPQGVPSNAGITGQLRVLVNTVGN